LVFDAKGGEIWRSDVWSLGGVHFFACIWNSCIALACLISVVHELWLACNNLWDLRYGVWCGWELELVVILWWSMVVISFCLSYDSF
jgi:hypothetical protein